MVVRFSAAICGTAIVLAATPAAMARTETGNLPAGSAIAGAASMYDPFQPGCKSGTEVTASASAMMKLHGPL